MHLHTSSNFASSNRVNEEEVPEPTMAAQIVAGKLLTVG
jgi:hypothetical protein